MQLQGATKLELDLYRAALRNEELPASEAQTAHSQLLCDAANTLQDMRQRGQLLLDACRVFHAWANAHDVMLNNAEFLKVYNTICDAVGNGSTLGAPLPLEAST